jgi:hypothetical protein
MFRASQCSSLGDRIVVIHHLVRLVCVTAWYAGPEGLAYQAVTYRLIIPDDVLIQFNLLMMSTAMLKTCREMK